MTHHHDTTALMIRAYDELNRICKEVSAFGWADATDIDALWAAISDIKYYSRKIRRANEPNPVRRLVRRLRRVRPQPRLLEAAQ